MTKKYTKVNYETIYKELEKFTKFASELTNKTPDACSHVWQVAGGMIKELQAIKDRAVRLERMFDKNFSK